MSKDCETTVIRIPKLFYQDHVDRDLAAPEIVRQTKRHYWIDATSEHLDELLSDANYHGDPACFDFEFGSGLAALILSARATERAIEKHLRAS